MNTIAASQPIAIKGATYTLVAVRTIERRVEAVTDGPLQAASAADAAGTTLDPDRTPAAH